MTGGSESQTGETQYDKGTLFGISTQILQGTQSRKEIILPEAQGKNKRIHKKLLQAEQGKVERVLFNATKKVLTSN